MEIIFDDWQTKLINHKGSVTAACGRQVGKSVSVGKRISDFMFDYAPCTQLITAAAQRQSSQLFIKTMGWVYKKHNEALEKAGGFEEDAGASMRRNEELRRIFEKDHGIFNELPTKTTVMLKSDFSKKQGKKNIGSILYALPSGKTGAFLRNYTLDFLHIDEAAYVSDTVYTALKPMLAISEEKRGLGWESLLSTPFGKGGFFYDSHQDPDYLQFNISAEDCTRISKKFLLKEKRRLTKVEYAQEYLGKFIDEFQQYFSTKLIKSRMNFMRWNYEKDYKSGLRYYYGHDYAGPGKDQNASVVAEMDKNRLKIVEPETDDEPDTHKTNCKIVFKDSKFKFKKLFVDSGGFGCGPTDELINMLGKRRVMGLDNAKKKVQVEGEETKKGILKEDLYSNAKSLMERGEIDIIDDLKLLSSLKSMTFEHTADKNLKIYGRNSHLAEAFVRACWAVKEKGLNIYIY